MISLALLDKDDLKILFEGFNTDFLSIPLKKPAKTLVKYVPTGFRIGKLPRNMLIRMYCDAVKSNEPSISEFVKNEISQNFEDRGINDYLKNVDLADPLSVGLAISELQSILLENGFTIPSYIVLLLNGVECNEAIKSASRKLYSTHVSLVEKASEDSEKRGKADAEAASVAAIDAAEKNRKKLLKRIEDLEKQLTGSQNESKELHEKYDELEESLCHARESESSAAEKIESLNKQIITLKNENQKLLNDLASNGEKMREYDSKLSELEKLHQQILELHSELSQAKEKAYSDVVIQRLCSEVLDELRASSLSGNEILNIAKKRFTDSDTIVDAWVHISGFSEEHIKEVIDNITNSNENQTTLDVIEEIEDGILIKFAVLKAIKSIIYNELETEETKRTIADKFTQKKD